MLRGWPFFVTFLLLPLCAILSVSCASFAFRAEASSEQRRPANDVLTGSTMMASGLLRSSLVNVVRQPITTVKLGAVVAWQRPKKVLSTYLPFSTQFLPEPAGPPGSEAFELTLDQRNFPPREDGKLTWLVDGPGFFPEFERLLSTSRKSVDVQVFIYDNDDIAVRYADLLRNKSADTRVRVLYDDLGSLFAQTAPPETPSPKGFVPPADMRRYLKNDSDVRVRRIASPWLVADHTKLLVFDSRIAVLGGMNIGREYYSEWHDLMVHVEGPIVPSLQREFNRTWRKAGPAGDFGLFRAPAHWHPQPKFPSGIPLRILRTDPAEGRYEVMDSHLMAIRSARKRIWIENPYIAHDDTILALEAAARRGVDVRVILPAKGDSTVMDLANLSTARILIKAGAKVYRYPRMTHMKVLLCDDWASIGSANLDTLSMCINRELNLAFSDRREIQRLVAKIFAPDLRASTRMHLKETESLLATLTALLANQL
ncbi:MAG: phosphatidylserine/phosphatidylglycerophosphate/cardiolipin synthase family protein [Luteolibacter sp.]